MSDFSEVLEKVIREELAVRKKVKELDLTGYERVNKDVGIHQLEELISRAEARLEIEKQ